MKYSNGPQPIDTRRAMMDTACNDALDFDAISDYVSGNGVGNSDGYSLRALRGVLQLATENVVEYYNDTPDNRAALIAEMEQSKRDAADPE